MGKSNYLILSNEFLKYCELNNIEDVEKYAGVVFDKGFTLVKYGDKPNIKSVSLENKDVKREKIIKPKKDIYGDE